MLIDHLQNADRYSVLHPGFADGFAFLRRKDLAKLPDGRHDIDGDRLFAVVSRVSGRGREQSPLEVHRRYIDIQFVVDGEDCIGWLPTSDCRQVSSPFDGEKDLGVFYDPPAKWLTVEPGTFALFYPEDAHAPLAASGHMHKVVVKVAVDW
ncbi:MAG TPA: YhcH/YjgK/YiaL family protein [Thermoguttaceae bacterium]|nr:YhcH/YjgK/YiaL family protein [Thermoguttaceae bacterium]